MTSMAVVETGGTTETTVVHHHHPRATAQGELVNVLPPWEQPLTPQSEANLHAQAKGRSQSATTVTVLATQRTSASPSSELSSPPVSRLLSNLVSSLATSLKLNTLKGLNTTVPLWHLVQ